MKTENTITKAVALEMINSSFPSIWSREDVISLINKIEDKVESNLSEQLEELKHSIIKKINRIQDDSDFIDYNSAEFELDYQNKITLQNVDFNIDMITDIVEEEFTNIESM